MAITVAVAALPMISALGCAIDYTTATMIRTRLQAAADAATLATVSINSPVIATARNMTGGGNISGGSTEAINFFNANLTGANGYQNMNSSATVTKTAMTIQAAVTFSAKVPTIFMGLAGVSSISISGNSTASYSLPVYINFYLMLDVSGSMSFPSTTPEQTRLQAVNPDNYSLYPGGCTFACHFTTQGACPQAEQASVPKAGTTTNPSPGGYCQGFIISRLGTTPASGNITGNNVNWNNSQVSTCATAGTTSCIQLRADAVGYAVNALLSTAASSEQVTNQFQVGLYPFIQNLYSYFPLTTSLTGSATSAGTINYAAAQLATLLDTGANANLGSGGTHFENALASMNSLIATVGSGVNSASPLPYVFLITDGSQDYQTQWGGSWSGSNSATTIPTSYCSTLKSRGITVAVLYIPYEPIQNPTTFANSEDYYANSNIPNIPTALQSCASTNFFYTATTPTDIQNALIMMFEQAVSTAHISD